MRADNDRTWRRGVSALELALVLPLLVTLTLGCIDFGRFAQAYIAVGNGARTGAGFATTHPWTSATRAAWEAQVSQAVMDEMGQTSGLDPSRLTIVITTTSDGAGGWMTTVDVSDTFQTLVPWPALPATFPLRQVVVMRSTRL